VTSFLAQANGIADMADVEWCQLMLMSPVCLGLDLLLCTLLFGLLTVSGVHLYALGMPLLTAKLQ